MIRIKARVNEDTEDQVERIRSTIATVDELQAIKEFEDNYKENSKFVDVSDLKKRINVMLEGI